MDLAERGHVVGVPVLLQPAGRVHTASGTCALTANASLQQRVHRQMSQAMHGQTGISAGLACDLLSSAAGHSAQPVRLEA